MHSSPPFHPHHHEDNQLDIPPSFCALHVQPGQRKPSIGHLEMAKRYELCEDLANFLTEKAAQMQFTLGITEELALQQCALGLSSEPAVVSSAEARWVVCRLAELLQWPMPTLPNATPPLDASV
jgi:hypothetical protein